MLPYEKEYEAFASEFFKKWFDTPSKLLGWYAQVDNIHKKGDSYHFSFTTKGDLHRIDYRKPHMQHLSSHYPKNLLNQTSTFHGERLYSRWYEVPNGTFFDDPKGGKDTIWPYWVRGIKRNYPDFGVVSTEEDWKMYLEAVKNHELVLNGRTGKFSYQSEKNARRNLEEWRDYIYNKSIQVMYIRRDKEASLMGVKGYKAVSNFGQYVSKNPASHQQVSFDESISAINHWQP